MRKIIFLLIILFASFEYSYSNEYTYPNDPKEFIKYFEQKYPNPKIRLVEMDIAIDDVFHYCFTNIYPPFFEPVLHYFKSTIDKYNEKSFLPGYYYMYAYLCFNYGKVDSSIYYFDKTIEFAKKYNRIDLLIHSNISLLANSNTNQKFKFDIYSGFLMLGVDNILNTNNLFAKASCYWTMMEYHYIKTKNADSASYYEKEARKTLDAIPENRFALKNFGNFIIEVIKLDAFTENKMNNLNNPKYLTSLNKYGNIIRNSLDRKLINFDYSTKSLLVNYYFLKMEDDSCLTMIYDFINNGTNIKDYTSILPYYYQILYKIEKRNGHYKSALEAYEKHIEFTAIMEDSSKGIQRLTQLMKLEKESYDERIKAEETNKKLTYLIILIIVIASIIIFYILMSRYRTIKKINSKLDEANSTKNKLFRIISHDLNGPAGSSLVLSEQLIAYSDRMSADDIKKTYQGIYRSNLQLKTLLDTLLQWSRINLDGFVVKELSVNVNFIVEEVIKELQFSLAKKKIELITEIPIDFEVIFDNDSLRVVLRNIISNAIKFTPELGKIIISCNEIEKHKTISISDNGIGFDENMLVGNLIKVESRTGTNNEKGLGLGLQIVKDITNRYKVDLVIKNNLEKGSKIDLIFNK